MATIINFFRGVVDELKKLHLPSKKEVYITLGVIAITILCASLMILIADFVISKLIKFIFGL